MPYSVDDRAGPNTPETRRPGMYPSKSSYQGGESPIRHLQREDWTALRGSELASVLEPEPSGRDNDNTVIQRASGL